MLLRLQTEMLEPQTYAQLALAMTLFSFGQVCIYGALNHGILRFFALAPRYGGYGAYRRFVTSQLIRVSLLWTAAVLAFAAFMQSLGQTEAAMLILMVLPYSVLNGGLSAVIAYGNASRARRAVALHQGLDTGLKITMLVLLTMPFTASVPLIFAAYATASLLTLGSLILWLKPWRLDAPSAPGQIAPVFRQFSGPIYLLAPFSWGLLVADRWALQSFADPAALAFYAVAAQMTLGPARVSMSAVLRFLAPRLFDQMESDKSAALRDVHKLTRLALLLTLLGWAATMILQTPISHLLLAPAYWDASTLLPWLVLVAGLKASAELVVLRLFGTLDSAALMRPRILTAVLGITLVFWGAWQFGVTGVIAAQITQSGIYLVWAMARAGFWSAQPA
ncbi:MULTISPECIES: lipopolysaccharide biosynthesis protein [unclassified Ruegeria]|uniref:lipopolysaccharide biosynthesis protein n=1 Tax=unclassified Ruegeria TaxID=2625375 RepID=UPI0014895E47|nr:MULTISPECIES: hypothetical protein [unclassified Ruegeria]